MPTVYLSGPITGLTYEGATDWRDKVTKHFKLHRINTASPMRAKAFLASQGILQAKVSDGYGLTSNQGVTGRDRFDTTNADCLLVNLLGATRVSIGTMIELGWADMARVPIVIVMEPDNIHQHCIANTLATYIFQDLNEAVLATVALLEPYRS